MWAVLGFIAIICGLIYCATWIVPLLVGIVAAAGVVISWIVVAVLYVVCAIPWCVWWLIDRKGAVAAIKTARK